MEPVSELSSYSGLYHNGLGSRVRQYFHESFLPYAVVPRLVLKPDYKQSSTLAMASASSQVTKISGKGRCHTGEFLALV